MPKAKALSPQRLLEIEQTALLAFRHAAEQLLHYGEVLGRESDVILVAQVLTKAVVEERANLEHHGERLAGVLRHENDVLHLLFEIYDPPVRQRFSIAHEIGHYFLHSPAGRPLYQCCVSRYVQPEESEANDEAAELDEDDVPDLEAEADAFAAAFLLPSDEVRADVARFGRGTSFLAQRYRVSEPTMRRRLRDLDSLTDDTASISINPEQLQINP